ncbi:hypothetical protein [Gellertiella hungarica]|uniref:Uncharacterized protein n=1 Tax=Gellertiella hungarica TaxID=1572859 RepID=A0A7W6J999_9HYPH|nr:hypothetical protein [Gellertiella hungarica]MBB4067170.1 hypothetical protein [Gellertiella hungarica]
MTPAERARQIDEEEFRHESDQLRARAFAYAEARRKEEAERFKHIRAEADRSYQNRKRKAENPTLPRDRLITFEGVTKQAHEWAKSLDLSHASFVRRCTKFGPEEAIRLGQRKVEHASRTLVTANGERKPLHEWAKQIGITVSGIHRRIRRGMTLEEAVTAPRARRKSSSRNRNRGVVSNLSDLHGTGGGSAAQEISEITFSERAK